MDSTAARHKSDESDQITMKKILFWIISAVLTVSVSLPAAASAPMAMKAGSQQSQFRSLATPAAPVNKRFVAPQMRQANSVGALLQKAASGPMTMRPENGMRMRTLSESAELPNLVGSVIYNDKTGADQAPVGMYKVRNGYTELLFGGPSANGGGIFIDGLYYATNYYSFFGYVFVTVEVYDYFDGTLKTSFEGNIPNIALGGLVEDPTTGTIYGITYNDQGNGMQLATLVYTENSVTTTAIAPLDGNWNSIVCDAQGQLYGISYTGVTEGESFVVTSSTLNKIDKATGAVTPIGETGMLPQYLSSAVIDHNTGKMYWNVCASDESGIMAEVNLTTGQATKLFDLADNDEIMALFIAKPEAEDNAPAAVSELAADFPNGSLSGTVSFKAPTTFFNGQAATGDLTYEILVNGEAVTGTTSFGATVSTPVTVASAGEYTISATVSNAVGKSPKEKISLFIGTGIPSTPVPTLVYENNNMVLTWEPVTETVDGGYIDPAAVTYTVTRADGSVAVENTSATTFSEAISVPEALTTYNYTVVAHNAGVDSGAGKSNSVVLGHVVPPYSNDFTEDGSLDGFNFIDGNNDKKIWSWSNGEVRISYNQTLAMDDWLISPPLMLEAGKAYYVSFTSHSYSDRFPERIEAKFGTAPTAEAMTSVLVEPTDVACDDENQVQFGAYMIAETSGLYYVGIHGISDADAFYLYVDNFEIGAATATTAPNVVTDIVITPDPNGDLKAHVAFKAPAVDFSGNGLNELTKVDVSRDGSVVKTFSSPAVGASLEFDDVMDVSGNVTYTFQAYNNSGAGMTASETVFIGVNAPAPPQNVNMVETANEGEVTITWDAVTTDYNGNPINPARVTYIIAEHNGTSWVPFVENLTATTYTFRAVEEGEQDFVQYGVFAVTDGGNNGAATPFIAVGTPYAGLNESFPNGTLNYAWATGFSANGGAWNIMKDADLQGVASQDGDGGYAAMKGENLDSSSALFTGKISLANTVNPGVHFFTYNIVGDAANDINEFAIYVKEPADADWTLLNTVVVNSLGDSDGWLPVTQSLQAYAGKVVQVRFQATTKQYVYTMMDNIKIGSMVGNDLVARSISAPAKVKAGEDYNVDVTVANDGTLDATSFSVELYADGEKVDTKTVESLAASEKTTVTFARNMSAVAEAPVKYYATVVYTADENPANNTTSEVTSEAKFSNLPAVTDLKGEAVAEGVRLTWSEPNLEGGAVEEKTDDFESYESWAQEIENWTFIDRDQSLAGGFQNLDIPGIVPGESLASFFVFDSAGEEFNATFAAHSGSKYLATLFRYDDGTIDEWAISPVLSGNAQTVSFYARSYSANYPEEIEVLYSTGSLNPDDFVKVKELKPVPGEWTLVEADLPAGAMYFAIHSCATGSFMLMVDDVTYEAGSATAVLSIVGYDVYRDGVKLTATPTGECEFVDNTAAEGEHTYRVVVVYETGISAPSNAAEVAVSGIDGLTAGAVRIAAVDHSIVVTGADGRNIVINSVDGRTVFAGVADAETRVAVSDGIYLVKVGTTVAKIIVK